MRRPLNFYAWGVVVATLILISVGGHVTTKGVGMSVPDWPLSFGQINPPGWWEMPGVRLEHGHRLVGALIGLLTLGLAVWTFAVERDSLARKLVVAAVFGVVLQGVLGGLRVNLVSTQLAVVHGCLGQLFLLLLASCAMRLGWLTGNAAAVSHSVFGTAAKSASRDNRLPRPALLFACVALPCLVFVNLIIAAIMRHYQAGMAIPTFPLAFGELIPQFVSFPITIHFAHRVMAVLISLVVLALPVLGAFQSKPFRWLTASALLFVSIQIALGGAVILTGRNEILTTLHVVNGAAVFLISYALAVRAVVALRAHFRPVPVPHAQSENAPTLVGTGGVA